MDSSGCDKSGKRWEQRGAAERSHRSRTTWVRLGAKRKRSNFPGVEREYRRDLLRAVRQVLVEYRARGHAGLRQLNVPPREALDQGDQVRPAATLDKDRSVDRDEAWPSDTVVWRDFSAATTLQSFQVLKGLPPSERAIIPARSRSPPVPWAVQQSIRARLCHQRVLSGPRLAAEDRFRNLQHTGRISPAPSRRLADPFRPAAHRCA